MEDDECGVKKSDLRLVKGLEIEVKIFDSWDRD